MNKTFVVGSVDVAAEEFDGEYVVLDIASGHYFSLASGSALIWRGLVEGHSAEALCAGLEESSPIRGQVAGVVSSLLEYSLLKAAPREPSSAADPIAEALAADGLTFEVEVFNDLADLLISDPVHDVDEELGWPHKPAG